MPDCASCSLFQLESENDGCLHVNRPGGLELTKTALASCRLPAGATILDAACGTGTTLQYLCEQGYQTIGMDLSINMLLKGVEQHTDNPVLQANCIQVPLSSSSQDAILMECALSLSNQTNPSLAEFVRLLRPGGWLVVTDIYIRELNNPHATDYLSDTSCLSGAQTEENIREMINQAGFSIQIWQDQTQALKQWMAHMIFQLGSLNAFYRQLTSCENSAQNLANTFGDKIKLGYYWMAAQKSG